jgi:hypothetical protein
MQDSQNTKPVLVAMGRFHAPWQREHFPNSVWLGLPVFKKSGGGTWEDEASEDETGHKDTDLLCEIHHWYSRRSSKLKGMSIVKYFKRRVAGEFGEEKVKCLKDSFKPWNQGE